MNDIKNDEKIETTETETGESLDLKITPLRKSIRTTVRTGLAAGMPGPCSTVSNPSRRAD